MSRGGWRRLEPRMGAILERIDVLKKGNRHPYLVGFRPQKHPAMVMLDGKRHLMMSSYSYLGLIGDDRINAAACEAVMQYGTATHGVRMLAGSLPLHHDLEKLLARLTRSDDAIVFASGYAANVGTIGALCGPRDHILIDKEDHASIVDGCRLSGAKMSTFRHNDPDDLDAKLSALDSSGGFRLVIVDGVYSMSGDIADLPALRDVCDRHDALLMVDEAHSLGLLGPSGLGIEDHFGRHDLIDIRMGTLSKAIPSVGGYVAGPVQLVDFLKHTARPFVFSAALPPAQAAAALAALTILEQEPWRVAHTRELGDLLRDLLRDAGFDTGPSQTAIIPLMTGSDQNAFDLAAECRAEGVIALPVIASAVARGQARLRITATAAHSEEDIRFAAAAFTAAARRSQLLCA